MYTSAQLNHSLKLADALVTVAQELTRAAARVAPARTRQRRGSTLRPGPQTPMWNALVLAVRPLLKPYGQKSKLARLLGVPPQRVHDYFLARRAAPDAERTLLLMHWLLQRRQGLNPG
jgi:hypothetical protein